MASKHVMSETELKSMTHEQLLTYAIQWLPTTNSNKRLNPNDSILDTDTTQQVKKDNSLSVISSPASTQKPKKRKKIFDMNQYGNRLIALRLMYEGWKFHGFASQLDSVNTVEHHLFAALIKTRLIESKENCDYSRSGRTDVGVSALGQIIGLRVRSNVVPPSQGKFELDYVKVINSSLPDGIRVLEWSPVPDGLADVPPTYDGDPQAIRDYWQGVETGIVKESNSIRRPGEAFSARFDAVHRSYKYFFVKSKLDIEAMRQAASYFEGNHDFRNFCRFDEKVTNFERLMYTVEIRRVNDDWNGKNVTSTYDNEYTNYYIFVKGQAFLWHQVRCMASILFDIGMGNEKPELVKQMLDDAKSNTGQFSNGKPQYRLASPTPLLLFECCYPKTIVRFPHSFEKDGIRCKTEYHDKQLASLERADSQISLSYASEAAKASILHAMLNENDAIISTTDEIKKQDTLKTFRDCRKPRNFLMDLNFGRHIPFHLRQREESINEKMIRIAQKRDKVMKQAKLT